MKLNKPFVVFGLCVVSCTSLCLLTTPNAINSLFAADTSNIPTEVKVITAPKTKYLVGERFDPTGMVVEVTFGDNYSFTLEYNSETASKFEFDETLLASTTTKVTMAYLGNASQTFDISVSVNDWYIDNVSLREEDGKVFFVLEGAYSESFEDNFENSYIYFAPHKDHFKYGVTQATLTPAESGGRFAYMTDVTNMPFSYAKDVFEIGPTNNWSFYWPHLCLEYTEGSAVEDKDVYYPETVKTTLHKTGDPEGEDYVLDLYSNGAKQIPVVARTDARDLSEFNPLKAADLSTVEDDYCYTAISGDIGIVNERVIMSITCAYKGDDLDKADLLRQFGFYLLYKRSGYTASAVIAKNPGSNFSLTPDFDVDFENKTFTFYVDITDRASLPSTSYYYYTRLEHISNSVGTDCTTLNKDNDGKNVTLNGKIYYLYNNHGTAAKDGYGTLTCHIKDA